VKQHVPFVHRVPTSLFVSSPATWVIASDPDNHVISPRSWDKARRYLTIFPLFFCFLPPIATRASLLAGGPPARSSSAHFFWRSMASFSGSNKKIMWATRQRRLSSTRWRCDFPTPVRDGVRLAMLLFFSTFFVFLPHLPLSFLTRAYPASFALPFARSVGPPH
jgi:hypothetical protein